MSVFELNGVDGLMEDLNKIRFDEVAPKMLDRGVTILKKEVIRQAVPHRQTGRMISSIKETKAKRTKDGYAIVVRPTGKDAKGKRNMEKMAYLEYGTRKQLKTPVISPAIKAVKESVQRAMQEVFNRETGR